MNDAPMSAEAIARIRSDLLSLEEDRGMWDEGGFVRRHEALDAIESRILEPIDGLPADSDDEDLRELKERAAALKARLEGEDERLFRRIRERIRAGECRGDAFRRLLDEHVPPSARLPQDGVGYDALDAFVTGILLPAPPPGETREREPEMVFYQPTPARIVLEMVDAARLTGDDGFYDVGSGLGLVSMLVALATDARVRGIDVEPAYCDYARSRAAELAVPAEFVHADARQADYTDGTVFFLYTPFGGRMMLEVLHRLRMEARTRPIRIFAYGPCTATLSYQPWLHSDDRHDHAYRLAAYTVGPV
jgi:Methyltransferase domain